MSAKNNERIELEAQPLNSGSVKVEVMTTSNGSNPVTVTKEKPLPLGLTKEELMKYANDPFWVKLRRTLFVLFWLIWVSMFVGAFFIIHYFPACSAASKLRWFQRGTCSQFNRQLFGNNLQSISSNMPTYMSAFEFDNLILPALFACDNDGNVKDFGSLDKTWGEMGDFDQLLSTLQVPQKVNVLVDLELGSTSISHPWFMEYLAGESDRSDFYVTVPRSVRLPNSLYQAAPFTITEQGGQKQIEVLTKSGRPMLNLNNDRVLSALASSLRVWTRKGVSGFRLLDAPYPLQSTGASNPDNTITQFNLDLDQNAELIARLTAMIKSLKSDAVLVVQLQSEFKQPDETSKFYGTDQSIVSDAVVSPLIADLSDTSPIDGIKLHSALNATIGSKPVWNPEAAAQGPWTGWLIDQPAVSTSSRSENHCLRNILAHLLPRGSPISYVDMSLLNSGSKQQFWTELGEVLRNESFAQYDHVRLYKELGQLRRNHVESLLFGSIAFPHIDSRVFTMARYAADAKYGFLLVANTDPKRSQSVNIGTTAYLPEFVHVQLTCASKRQPEQQVSLKTQIDLDPSEVIVFRFQILI